MLEQYGQLGIYLIASIIFPFIVVFVPIILRRKRPNPEKLTAFECGVDTQGPTWVQFKIHYFMYALVFVVFDVETIFLYPWAVKFQSLGLFGFIEMIIFIGILVIGLWYAWKEGALEWM
ncbi:NADH-quinone oxidoreductase subunit A [Dehalobacterium formicoaceticum]|uniref:NADH-quinone oxidoreductase subunit A n=1 Tax=Dehalobacterium formicoaceticum TaxID=51515 RepID=A0ABT1Y6Z5_9FIRM|nr:NADH-quinone oxidoreductase subunit A [Dehalobacterium formicoaceticum]MCR6546241.1 NADH-quinone oxidoreductase subunit A [Dehalobacterium formicoaceticum]